MTIALPAPQQATADAGPLDLAREVATYAALVSICAFAWFHHLHVDLAYKDAISHLEISRRIIDSPTTGFGQLGGVWLPLPHLLMLPFIWIGKLYYTGLAGSLVSMAAYVIASALIYKIVLGLTGKNTASIGAALVFMLNPGVLYMQSTPMTEVLLFACLAGMVYGVQSWILEPDRYQYLIGAGAASFFGTLTRYEAWVLLPALIVIVMLVLWRKHYSYRKAEDTLLAFVLVGGTGIVAWLGWNQLVFGNALNFQNGEYAKPSLWVGANDIAVGHPGLAFQTYWYAIVDNLGLPVIGLAVIGGLMLVATLRSSLKALPVLSLLVFVPFFGLALLKGQRPLHVTQINGDLYNVRFGLLMVIPAAVFIGYVLGAAGRLRILHVIGWIALAGITGLSVWTTLASPRLIATLREPVVYQHVAVDTQAQTAAFLRGHYDGGHILMQFFGNESVLFDAQINLINNVYEGSYRLWEPALAYPADNHVQWIVMRRSAGTDLVYTTLHDTARLDSYKLVYTNRDYYVYGAK